MSLVSSCLEETLALFLISSSNIFSKYDNSSSILELIESTLDPSC